MEKLAMDDMKAIELEIMDEIDRVCRENGINYMLGYGSCLGAVRHGGFIPWDDDMDVVMLRGDYERFAAVFEDAKEIERFKLVSYRDKSAPCAFFKVTDVTTWVEERYSDAKYGSGVWVDIFPLDEISLARGGSQFKCCRMNGNLRYLAVTDTSTGSTGLIKFGKKLICPILKKIGPYGYARKMDECARSAEGSGSGRVTDFIGETDPRKVYDAAVFEPLEWDFEGHKFFIPKGYDEMLTIMYGDWRTPLPEADREAHTLSAYRL